MMTCQALTRLIFCAEAWVTTASPAKRAPTVSASPKMAPMTSSRTFRPTMAIRSTSPSYLPG